MEASRQRKSDYDTAIEDKERAAREEVRRLEEFRSRCTLLAGDVIEQLRTLPAGSVDLIITSPPYNLGAEQWPMGGQEQAPRQPRAGGIGYDDAMSEDEYQAWQVRVFIELYRVAKDGASFFYNHKVRQRDGEIIHPMDWLRCPDNPWLLRQEIIWDRKSTHNHTPALFWPQDERIYWMTKGKPELKEEGIKMPSVWIFHGPVANTWHPAPFSPELPTRIMEQIERPGITVLDPFAGSFTTIQVALERGHKAIGVDISSEYIKQAIEEHQWPIAA
jgi:site-specific DNA-methyltransferase (adenine-specific)